MANTAAHIVGAKVQFGVMSGSTFSADSLAMIEGDAPEGGHIYVRANKTTLHNVLVVNGAATFAADITVAGSIKGNATSASKLSGNRTMTLTGDISGSKSWDTGGHFSMPISVNSVKGVAMGNSVSPAGSSILSCNGYFYASKVYNSVWNDIADFVEVEENTVIEYGRAYIKDNNGHSIANKYAQPGLLGIASDTYGFGVGQKSPELPQLPIAIGGFVLAYTDVYESGTPLTSGRGGILTKANILTRLFNPERIIATFYKLETAETWHDLEVNGRHWVKVK